jgi:hypothetical protein
VGGQGLKGRGRIPGPRAEDQGGIGGGHLGQ